CAGVPGLWPGGDGAGAATGRDGAGQSDRSGDVALAGQRRASVDRNRSGAQRGNDFQYARGNGGRAKIIPETGYAHAAGADFGDVETGTSEWAGQFEGARVGADGDR